MKHDKNVGMNEQLIKPTEGISQQLKTESPAAKKSRAQRIDAYWKNPDNLKVPTRNEQSHLDYMDRRRRYFEEQSSETKDAFITDVIESAQTNDGKMLEIIHLMGRDTDFEWAQELPTDQDTRDLIEGFIHISRQSIFKTENSRLEEKLNRGEELSAAQEVLLMQNIRLQIESAEKLAELNLIVLFTHATTSENLKEIRTTRSLDASGDGQYIGRAVYAGIGGGYYNWVKGNNDDNILRGRIALNQGLTLVYNPIKPQAMIAILGDWVPAEHLTTIAEQIEFDAPIATVAAEGPKILYEGTVNHIPEYSLELLRQLQQETDLDIPSWQLRQNKQGETVVVFDTDEAPVVWGAIANAVGLWAATSASEIRREADHWDVVSESEYLAEQKAAEIERRKKREERLVYYDDDEELDEPIGHKSLISVLRRRS